MTAIEIKSDTEYTDFSQKLKIINNSKSKVYIAWIDGFWSILVEEEKR